MEREVAITRSPAESAFRVKVSPKPLEAPVMSQTREEEGDGEDMVVMVVGWLIGGFFGFL